MKTPFTNLAIYAFSLAAILSAAIFAATFFDWLFSLTSIDLISGMIIALVVCIVLVAIGILGSVIRNEK